MGQRRVKTAYPPKKNQLRLSAGALTFPDYVARLVNPQAPWRDDIRPPLEKL